MNWHEYFLGMADYVSTKSKDQSCKVGCVIVGTSQQLLSTGYNDLPRRVNDTLEGRRVRPIKYKFTEHAERNAIYNAARSGIKLEDSTMYLGGEFLAGLPCSDCARAIIQSGITTLISRFRDIDSEQLKRWAEDVEVAKTMLREACITVAQLGESDAKLVQKSLV